MIFTSYLSKMKQMPKEWVKVVIMRKPPFSYIPKKSNREIIVKSLAPSDLLHNEYSVEKSLTWEQFEKKFKEEMKDMEKDLYSLLELEKKGFIVVLICCEKDYIHCHRNIEADWYRSKGVEVREY